MANKIGPLPWQTPLVEPDSGKPTNFFIRIWQDSFLRADAFDATIDSLSTGKADKTITLTAGAGLTGGGDLSANRTFDVANTTVTPGAYTLANITVNSRGQITAAANGTVAGTLPTGGTAGQVLQKIDATNYNVTWTSLTAGIIASTATGTVAATNVQAAIAELAAEKVQGPGASTDQCLVRWNGTAGFSVLNSGVLLDASNNMSGINTLSIANDAYNATTWNGSTLVPTKDAIRDKFESLPITSANAQIPAINAPWINYGGGFGGARYYKDAAGIVHIEGLIQAAPGNPTSGVTLFTLLAGYRPPDTLMFVTYNGGGAGRIDVDSAGNVVMQSGNTAFTSLSGISFIPA